MGTRRAVSVRRIGPNATPHRTAELRRPSLRVGVLCSSSYSLHLTPGRPARSIHPIPIPLAPAFPFSLLHSPRALFLLLFPWSRRRHVHHLLHAAEDRQGIMVATTHERDVDAAPAGLGGRTYALDAYGTVVAWPHAACIHSIGIVCF